MPVMLVPTAPAFRNLQPPSLSMITSPSVLVHSFKSTVLVSTKGTSTSPPSPRIPPELCLQIISSLAIPDTSSSKHVSNLAVICDCSLVSKFWLHVSREHLWRLVRLGGGRRGSTLPSFASYVMHLSVRESRGESWDPKWLNAALPTLARSFPNLCSLEAERVTLEYLSTKSRSALIKGFNDVRKLALGACEFRATRDMIDFIAEFEELESLTLDGVRCVLDDAYAEAFGSRGDGAVPQPPRKLRELAIRGVRTPQVLNWIRMAMKHHEPQAVIQVLRLGALGVKSAPAVGKFLKMLGPNLKELHIGFDAAFIEDGDEIVSHIDFSHNNSLEQMHLYGLVIPSLPPPDPSDIDPQPQPPQLMSLTSLLSRARTPSIRTLSLALHPADLHALVSMDFAGLSDLFDRAPWTSLQEVQVVVANEDDGNMDRSVKQRLGRLFERGVLRVNVGFDDREVIS